MRIPQHLKDRGIETIVGLDFETYWERITRSRSYRPLSTSVTRASRRSAWGSAAMPNPKRAGIRPMRWSTTLSTLDWSKTALLAHHAHFDGHILTHHLRPHPGLLPLYPVHGQAAPRR